MRKNLDLKKRDDKRVLWRKITRALKEIYEPKINVKNNEINKKEEDTTVYHTLDTKDFENIPNPDGKGKVLPAPSNET